RRSRARLHDADDFHARQRRLSLAAGPTTVTRPRRPRPLTRPRRPQPRTGIAYALACLSLANLQTPHELVEDVDVYLDAPLQRLLLAHLDQDWRQARYVAVEAEAGRAGRGRARRRRAAGQVASILLRPRELPVEQLFLRRLHAAVHRRNDVVDQRNAGLDRR